MKAQPQAYDIIGDIHGHAVPLRNLLEKLGYVEQEHVYRHPDRKAIFLGDFIDRGPMIRDTLMTVWAMVDAGTALAVMGNHEYNAICFHTEDGQGGHLLSHTVGNGKNAKHLKATHDQVAIPSPELWEEFLEWFKALPLFLDLGDLRIVHACWDQEQIDVLGGGNRLDDELLRKSAQKGTPEHRAIRVLLKGKEIALPGDMMFTTKSGDQSHEIRTKWWMPSQGHTYHSLCMPECEGVPETPVPAEEAAMDGYARTEPPVVIGHYWLPPGRPELLAPNVACVDYSVAGEDGKLVAYRWDGEQTLDERKFLSVSRGFTVEGGFKLVVDRDFPPGQRYEVLGEFATLEGAWCAAMQMVRDTFPSNLPYAPEELYGPFGYYAGVTADELYKAYMSFGPDPWIVGPTGKCGFSAWAYAKRCCHGIIRELERMSVNRAAGLPGTQIVEWRSVPRMERHEAIPQPWSMVMNEESDDLIEAQPRYAAEHAAWNNHFGTRTHILWAVNRRASMMKNFYNEPGLEKMRPFLRELLLANQEDPGFGVRMEHIEDCAKTDVDQAWQLFHATPLSLRRTGLFKSRLATVNQMEGYPESALPLWAELRRLWPDDISGFGNAITCLLQLDRREEAERLLDESPACFRRYWLYWNQRAQIEGSEAPYPPCRVNPFRGQPDLGGLLIPAEDLPEAQAGVDQH